MESLEKGGQGPPKGDNKSYKTDGASTRAPLQVPGIRGEGGSDPKMTQQSSENKLKHTGDVRNWMEKRCTLTCCSVQIADTYWKIGIVYMYLHVYTSLLWGDRWIFVG